MLSVSIQDFGENMNAPIVNGDGTQYRADACRAVDFTLFGARVQVLFSAICQVDTNTTAAGKIALIAAAAPDAVTGTHLADLPLPIAGTLGSWVEFDVNVIVPNPGGLKYLVVASQAGV